MKHICPNKISFQFFYMFLFFVKLAVQLGIYHFVLYFGMLILRSSETCLFICNFRFSKGRLVSFVFVLFILIRNVRICII